MAPTYSNTKEIEMQDIFQQTTYTYRIRLYVFHRRIPYILTNRYFIQPKHNHTSIVREILITYNIFIQNLQGGNHMKLYIGSTIRKLRVKQGYTQDDLVVLCNISSAPLTSGKN